MSRDGERLWVKNNIWGLFDHWWLYVGEKRNKKRTFKKRVNLNIFLSACYQGNKWLRVTQPSAVENMSLAKIHFLPRQQKNSAEKVQLEDMGLQLLIQRHTSSLHPFKNCCHNAFFYMSECGFCLQKNVFYCEPYIKCYCCVWVSSWQWLVFHDIFTVIDLILVT